MTRLKLFLQTSVQAIFVLILTVILVLCLFSQKWEYFCKKGFPYQNAVYLLAGLLILGLLFCVLYFLTGMEWGARYSRRLIAAGSVLLGVVLLVFSYHYYFKTGWDSSVLVRTADHIARSDTAALDNWYYSIYPNNVLLTYLFSLIIRFCGFLGLADYYYGLIAVQCVLYAVGAYLIYRCAEMLFDGKAYAVWVWIVYIGLAGLSPWVVIPYSDSVGIFMVLLCFYFYLRVKNGSHRKIFLFLLLMCVYLGYKIKPQIVIIGVAMALAAVLEALDVHKVQWQQLAAGAFSAVAGLLAALFIMTAVVSASGLQMDEGQTFGWPHYLMMGLNNETNGGYCNDDVIYSQTVYGQDERKEANFKVVKERLADYGAIGLITFWGQKLLTVYNDGTFAWTNEGEFFEEMYEKGNPSLQQALKGYYYPDGLHFTWFMNVSQTLWMAVLFLGICAFRGPKRTEVLVLMMAVVGLTMFEFLFEARARYLFAYVPVYIMLAGAGILNLTVTVQNAISRRADNHRGLNGSI